MSRFSFIPILLLGRFIFYIKLVKADCHSRLGMRFHNRLFISFPELLHFVLIFYYILSGEHSGQMTGPFRIIIFQPYFTHLIRFFLRPVSPHLSGVRHSLYLLICYHKTSTLRTSTIPGDHREILSHVLDFHQVRFLASPATCLTFSGPIFLFLRCLRNVPVLPFSGHIVTSFYALL